MTVVTPAQPLVALLHEKFGVYHTARLKASRVLLDVTGMELRPYSADYSWFQSEEKAHLIQIFSDKPEERSGLAKQRMTINKYLDAFDPDVVALPGWSELGSLLALEWCGARGRPAIMMCDSTYIDAQRSVLTEWTKRIILSGVAAAFASGARSVEYLEFLGMSRERIVVGYDVVDNRHFREGARAARANSDHERKRLGLPTEYCLFVGRLVEKKNISALLRAYSMYRKSANQDSLVHLVIVGEGELGSALRTLAGDLGLGRDVFFFGHADYLDLPAIYGLARFFVLPSIVEQWGLVVNEALASGLPVLVSNRSGASADLVEDGRNGFVFDPNDVLSFAEKLRFLANQEYLESFRQRSQEIVASWDLDRYARGLAQSVQTAIESGTPPGIAARLMARSLLQIASVRCGMRL